MLPTSLTENQPFQGQSGQAVTLPQSAYLHIPFCRRRCYYCDFPISVLGMGANPDSLPVEEYLEALTQEISLAPAGGQPLQTVFFGGGTPSLLSPAQLNALLECLDSRFGLAAAAEISLEIDPGTFDGPKLQGYLQAGINRFSLGIQAFQEELLQLCGRSHNRQEILISVELLHQAGVSNLSFDLISGLPHQSEEQWVQSLQGALALAPQHLSCYDLVLEPITAFGRLYQTGKQPLPADETTAQMYRLAQQHLSDAGYEHYEISNYAQSGYQCRHNQVYWQNQPYYGFGMGAASYVNGQRFTRPRNRREYYLWLAQLRDNQGKINCPVTSLHDELLETLMLGLRQSRGIDLLFLGDKFGHETVACLWRCLQSYLQQGWVEFSDRQGHPVPASAIAISRLARLRLSDPEGFLFSNQILTALFEQLTP
ncbi:MAG: coproporphyrinogen III oxidase [Chloroflexaceae bacterium]|nr:coproporphyrinogen III oxidase [Chloroflexaceae bacterium]